MTISVLRIDGTIRSQGSRSTEVADHFFGCLGNNARLLGTRQVGLNPPLAPNEAFVIANQEEEPARSQSQRDVLSASDELIAEFLAADVVIVASPMYNFSVGTGIKAWVDNLIRKDKTFRLGASGIEQLATGKRMVVISSRGLSYAPASPFASADHVNPWFRDIFGFIGVQAIDTVVVDNLDFAGPEAALLSIQEAKAQVEDLAREICASPPV